MTSAFMRAMIRSVFLDLPSSSPHCFITVPPETHSELIPRAQKIEFESFK